MNIEINNGGQAFPNSITGLTGNLEIRSQNNSGMTLRDYLAAKAMSSLIQRWSTSLEIDVTQLSIASYKVSDAMLSVRMINPCEFGKISYET